MAQKIQLRRDTPANWASVDPILSAGEMGLVIDPVTGKIVDMKLGDGELHWNAVPYWVPSAVRGEPKLVPVSDGWAMPPTVNVTSGAGTGKMHFKITSAVTAIRPLFIHWQNTGLDVDPSGPIVFAASVEVISTTAVATFTGVIYPLLFGGRHTVTLDPGGQIMPDLLGITLMPGDVIAVRTYLSSGTAYAPKVTYGTTAGVVMAGGGFTPTTDLTAPASAAIAASSGNYYGPAVIMGYAEKGAASIALYVSGDSISVGAGDTALYSHPEYGTGSFLSRATYGVAGMLNVGVGGGTAGAFVGSNFSFRRWSLAHLCTSGLLENGSNGFYGGSTCAQEQAYELEIANRMRREGITKIFITTTVPRTTSTDAWATLANQTVLAGNSERVLYNDWARAGCPINPTTKAAVAVGTSGALLAGQNGHPITGYFETADQVESSRNSGKWAVTGVRVRTGSVPLSSNIITSSDAAFVNTPQEDGGDRGSYFSLAGAGAAGGYMTGPIIVVSSGTQIATNLLSTAAVTGAVMVVGAMTSDGTHPSGEGHDAMSHVIDVSKLAA